MPEHNALLLLVLVPVILVATQRWHVMPFLALLAADALYGVALGSSLPWVAKEFNMGFGATIAATGLAVVAGAMLAQAAREGGATPWRVPGAVLAGCMAGLGGTPISALAVLSPVAAVAQQSRTRIALVITHAVTAVHGCLPPSPLPIAALAILGGDWRWCLALGLPTAIVQTGAGLLLARRAPDCSNDETRAPVQPSPRTNGAILSGIVIMIVLIIGHSFGQMPSEPLGGGNMRENILGLGRPMILLLAGTGVALVLMRALGQRALAEDGWLAEGARRSAGIVLAIGAAGGLQMTLYNTGTAALLAEKMLVLPPALGIALPFLLALVCRALQGSALTAVITAAGLMQPMLAPLGLDGDMGRALTVIAVGTGAMAVPHVNDGFFWLAAHQAGLRPLAALARITGGCLVQGGVALAVLMSLAGIIGPG